MCLKNDPKEVEKLKSKKSAKIIAYKVLRRVDINVYPVSRASSAVHLCSPIGHISKKRWKAGVNKSNSRIMTPCVKIKNINRGIHVFRKKNMHIIMRTFSYCTYSLICVPVTCYLKDLIGANVNEAVFKEVHLSAKSYAEALKVEIN